MESLKNIGGKALQYYDFVASNLFDLAADHQRVGGAILLALAAGWLF